MTTDATSAVQALTGRGLPESTGAAAALWQDCASYNTSALYCPFVTSLAHGTLPK